LIASLVQCKRRPSILEVLVWMDFVLSTQHSSGNIIVNAFIALLVLRVIELQSQFHKSVNAVTDLVINEVLIKIVETLLGISLVLGCKTMKGGGNRVFGSSTK
jgi:hypothetical protein